AARAGSSAWVRRGRLGLVVGCVGMPSILSAACFLWVEIKYLLPIPALAATFGIIVGLVLARRSARPLEQWGWLLVAVSVNLGLLVGLYAFDGPLPAPPTQQDYHALTRRLLRLGHAYAIVLGLLAIAVAETTSWRLPAALLVAGTCVTLLAIGVVAVWPDATAILAAGPALVALALVAAWPWRRAGPV